MLVVLFTNSALATIEFVHNFDMYGDYNEYLFSTTNAQVRNEGSTKYWCTQTTNSWSDIIYKYDLPFSVDQASLRCNIYLYPYREGSQGFVDVSADGNTWTTVASGQLSINPVWINVDISSILKGSNTAYVRSRLYSVGWNIYAQFLRTHLPDPNYRYPNIYEFRASPVPEPLTLSLLVLGGMAMLRRREL